jgi:hypothetical protein
LHELHDDTSNVREQKHCLVLNEYNSFAMRDDELVRDMYSRLNLIINELNSIGINKLGDTYIVLGRRQRRHPSLEPFAAVAGLTETKRAGTPFASFGTLTKARGDVFPRRGLVQS